MKLFRPLFVIAVVVLFLVTVILPGTTLAQYCGGSGRVVYSSPPVYHSPPVYSYSKPVHKEVIVKEELVPIAVPVLIPVTTFQYLPALTTPVVTYTQPAAPVQPVASPNPAPVIQQPVQQVQGTKKPCLSPEEIDRLIMIRLEALLKGRQLGGTTTLTVPVVNGPPPIDWGDIEVPVNQPQQPQTPASPVKSDWVGFMKSNCYACHGGGKRQGGVQLFDASGAYAPDVSKKEIVDSILSGRMPKGNPLKLDQNQTISLSQWVSQ
jgi:hypothetical protein